MAVLVALLVPQGAANEELVGSWYPILQAGNTWVYADEARDAGSDDHGLDDPTIGRWTTTETVSNVDVIPEGTHVTIHSTISGLVKLHDWMDNSALMTPSETELLVRGSCVYRLRTTTEDDPDDTASAYDANHTMRPAFRKALAQDDVPPAYCFPMRPGREWGRVPSTSPAGEDISEVEALNGDPFGTPGGRTFHVSDYQGAGETIDYWFQQGVGVVQYVYEHHGTYGQHRRILTSATANGRTRTFDLQPARTAPLEPGECRDEWRHWIRADGTLIPDLPACVAYARGR
jgi:hypothetical protein